MISIDKELEENLKNAIKVVERMLNANVDTNTKSLIYFNKLGLNRQINNLL